MTTKTQLEIFADRRLRIVQAVQRAGLSLHQVGSKLKRRGLNWSLSFTKKVLEESDVGLELPDLVLLADLLHVDARWLATGASSPAALAAMAEVEYLSEQTNNRLYALGRAVQRELTRLLAMMPQPVSEYEGVPNFGVCRYCGCTWEHACASGCEWVDEAETICSACLDPLRPEDYE